MSRSPRSRTVAERDKRGAVSGRGPRLRLLLRRRAWGRLHDPDPLSRSAIVAPSVQLNSMKFMLQKCISGVLLVLLQRECSGSSEARAVPTASIKGTLRPAIAGTRGYKYHPRLAAARGSALSDGRAVGERGGGASGAVSGGVDPGYLSTCLRGRPSRTVSQNIITKTRPNLQPGVIIPEFKLRITSLTPSTQMSSNLHTPLPVSEALHLRWASC
ncbi:hypothetical protein SKAU_G00272870 [Synaphobranchus kaupii]|uniref:Uncharacterized protein n=1 Tax=Synaphobranchus kaupii TaxID=118154 RepID=A0A9Q1F0Q0_SYNKA|nr:hypothetical protein SKAU_G00272870 [Synaphobranchus kaupii]